MLLLVVGAYLIYDGLTAGGTLARA